MKVKVGQVLVYHPNLLDRTDGRTSLKSGDVVKVINVHGCPKANTMGHCYVGEAYSGAFIGLVSTNSLHTREEYKAYLREKIAAIEAR
jgi:hypothetical protein